MNRDLRLAASLPIPSTPTLNMDAPNISSRRLRFLLAFCAAASIGRSQPVHAPLLQVRLQDHLTSYATSVGTGFHAVVTVPLEIGGRVAIPRGSVVYGSVVKATAVGFGFIHERAALVLDFRECVTPDGRGFPFQARLHAIDNAREHITPRGTVQGILAANSPANLRYGLFREPSSAFFYHSLIGATGPTGQLWTEYGMGPFAAAGFLAVNMMMFRFPEPEIHFAPGTDMELAVSALPEGVAFYPPPFVAEVPEPLAAELQTKAYELTKRTGKHVPDIVNVAFLGSREQLMQAFAAAGWLPAEPTVRHSISHYWGAIPAMNGYAAAPVSTVLYDGAEPGIVFERSLNTISKRHHIRIWSAGVFSGREIWLAAASHDTGISFAPRQVSFTHKIDPSIDVERSKIVNDLDFAGCLDPIAYLDRPTAARSLANGDGVSTDGRLAVLTLADCSPPPPNGQPIPAPPGSKAKRFARRMVLVERDSILRQNPYYWTYRAIRRARSLHSAAFDN